MTLKENNLALTCRQAEDSVGRLVHWVYANSAKMGLAVPSLVRELEARRTSLKVLARSASRPPTIGVAGPSVIGRSLVVSGLAKPETGRITVQFAGLPYGVDYAAYLEQIASDKGVGVVTRLSPRPRSTPPGFPVPVRLLSAADVARILASVHFGEHVSTAGAGLSRDEIEALCRRAAKETAPYPIPGLSARDVVELREYLETYFGDDTIVRTLATTDYWDVFSQVAPRLTDTMRAELLGLLWSGLPQLTHLYQELVDALGRLGHSGEAFLPLEAIVDVDPARGAVSRARSSLLDVGCQLDRDPGGGDLVVVHGQKGHKPAIPRAALSGIIAEVRFTLATPSGAGMAEIEIVEYPGHCASGPGEAAAGIDAVALRQLFLKCKSLYLLQRSAHERELTSLVVCADEKPCDLGRFPEVLAEWVELVHGASPADREAVDAGLFIALVETAEAAAQRASHETGAAPDWSGRLSAALFESLNVLSDWPGEWTPGRAFDNVFLLRAPVTPAASVRLLAAAETAPAAEMAEPERLSEARGNFMRDTAVGRHIGDPLTAWNEAQQPDDGGVSYLNQSIAGVSDSFNRHRQVSQALGRIRAACADRLRRFNSAEELFAHREARHRAALIAVARLKRAAQRGHFGHLLRAFQVPASELADVLHSADKTSENDTLAAGQGLVTGHPGYKDAGEDRDRTERARRLAISVVGYWIASMRTAAANPRLAWEVGVPGTILACIVDELMDGAERLQLLDTIARQLGRVVIRNMPPQDEAEAASVVAADTIAAFVKWLGYQSVAGDRRPRRRDKARTPIFPPRQVTGAAAIASGEVESSDRYHLDWCQGYVAMVEANVLALFEKRARGEAEGRLGEVLRNLESNSAEAQP